jgi:hypothetical protein
VDVVTQKAKNMATLREKSEKQFEIITKESDSEELKDFSE